MNIEDVLRELGNQMGLPNLKLDENKVCRLIFDKKFTIDIEASEDLKTVHIYSALCTIPPSNKEPLYEALLEANLFGRGTGGAAFGVDLEMGEVLLSSSLQDMDRVDYQDFVNVLESFVNHVEAWTEKIDSGNYTPDRRSQTEEKKGPRMGGSDGSSSSDMDDTPPPPPTHTPPPGFIVA